MVSPETAELLRRARRLKAELEVPVDPESDEALDEALETLRRLAGRPSRSREAATFEQEVAKALQSLPGVVVADRPRTGSLRSYADFFVKAGEGTFLVEAKAPRLRAAAYVRREVQRLQQLVELLGADHAFLVLPNPIRGGASEDRAVSVVTLPQLLERIRQSSNRNEVNVA
jgi:hypothetical protein